MAGRIQGITVEIGGDTTKLQTALKGINTEIRNTQSQLKDVDKLLKLDPGNTELLAQKHRLLAQAVTETKEKLETLKTAAAQADEALKNGTITQEQYDGLQREIAETEAKLKSLEEQANQSATALQKIAADGEKLKTMGDNVTEVGKKFLPVTGVVAGLGTAVVKTVADFDSAMSQVAAVSGATGSDLDALRDKAREMGAKTKFSASEAAEAMNYMAMAGWKTSDMLSGIGGVMNLAAASGEDLATTSDIVTDALTAFGLTAADSGHFADILVAASSNANTNVSMMGIALFHRDKRKLTLNAAGLVVAEFARRILLDEQAMLEGAYEADRRERTITLASCGVLTINRLIPILTQSFPGKSIVTDMLPDAMLIKRLKNRACQFIVLHKNPHDPQLFCQRYLTEQLYISVPSDHSLAKKKSLKAKDLDGCSILTFDVGFWVELCREKLPDTLFMLQTDTDTMEELVDSSNLLVFNSDRMLEDGYTAPGRIDIPINEPFAKATYYVACLDSEKSRYTSFFNAIRSEVISSK